MLDRYLPEETLLIYIDEKRTLRHAKRYGGLCWSDERLKMDIRQLSYGKVCLFGAYDPKHDCIWLIPVKKNNSEEFCEAMIKLWVQLNHSQWKQLLIIMDNVSYHQSKLTQKFLNDLPNCKVIFLPPYSPELNPVEQFFCQCTKEVSEMRTFYSETDVLGATYRWQQYYNSFRSTIFSLGGIP